MELLSNIFEKPQESDNPSVVKFHSVSSQSGENEEIVIFDSSLKNLELAKIDVDEKITRSVTNEAHVEDGKGKTDNIKDVSIYSEDFVEDGFPADPEETGLKNLGVSGFSTDCSKSFEKFLKCFEKFTIDDIEKMVLEKVPYCSPLCCFHLKPRRAAGASIKRVLFEKLFCFRPAVTKEEIRLYALIKIKNPASDTNIQEKLIELLDVSSERMYRSPFCWFSLTEEDLEKNFWRKVKSFLRFKPVNVNKVFFVLDCQEVEDWVDKTVDCVHTEKIVSFEV